MKKQISLVLALTLAMTLLLTACGGAGGTGETGTTTTKSATVTTAAATEPTTTTTAAEVLESGMEGVGEKTFDTPFFTMTVPKDVKYELYTYLVTEDDNRGTIQIDFGPDSTLQARLHVSTTRMISSLDDAHDECLRVQNLDTYEEGRYEDMDNLTFGGVTYKVIHVTTEWSDEIFLVTYFKRAADGVDFYVECKLDQDGFGYDAVLPSADFVTAAMNSVVFKK